MNSCTFIGNLTRDPELRFTSGGSPVVGLGIAVNEKWTDRNGAEHEKVLFLDVSAWRELAENAAESLSKGDRVLVTGKLRDASYEKDGASVKKLELEAFEITPSLRFARVSVAKQSAAGSSSPSGSAPFEASDSVPF